jgi:hypothetical protein
LCSTPDAVVETVLVSVVPAVSVGEEEGVDIATFKDLRQFDPIFEFPLRGGLVLGVLELVQLLSKTQGLGLQYPACPA